MSTVWERVSEKFDATTVALSYRPDLDGLRAISCLLVFFFHLKHSESWHGMFPWLDFLQGWIGVYVFFVLSGYLITSLLIAEEGKRGKIKFGSFILRREFRIVPAYYATIAAYAILCLTPLAHQFKNSYLAGVWYWISYNGDVASRMPSVGTLFGHSWSLAIEQRFYLVWPFLLFAITRSWSKRLIIFPIVVIGVLYSPIYDSPSYLALLMGSGIAVAHGYGLGGRLLCKTPMLVSVALTIACFALVYRSGGYLNEFSGAVALLMYHLTIKASGTRTALGFGPLAWLGRRSYSFYLLHVICLNAALRIFVNNRVGGALLDMSIGLVLTIIASAISYQFIEEPFRKFGRRLTREKPLVVIS
jgi:peptidoglycan/LPS O-acetylase OafA/YrhL